MNFKSSDSNMAYSSNNLHPGNDYVAYKLLAIDSKQFISEYKEMTSKFILNHMVHKV